ncbi:MAG TPA: TetR/AcrR family transcriptional regulator [Planktothrix sp. UBA8407]|jgi:Transcriptional regulator|nr:TetR/AcrR family transcriptional regulator [Planktothrix sp. UBA8402]HAO11836.1 TetR/AcrR family transcriptional regulator [Planktothrix sp. UBA8407]HBK21608.1 TetR/AcrR family transcriptional regulator [Planktothrix sp. UBA10369]
MPHLNHTPSSQLETQILSSARCLFAQKGYDHTTTRDLATAAGVAEATLFRHFANKKAILVAIVIEGWVEILTDLLTELSSISNYKSVAQLLHRRMINLHENADIIRICFLEAQFHPELRDRIQSEIINKMIDVTEAFFETAIQKGVYRPMNPKIVAQVFLGMFTIAGFSYNTFLEPNASPQEMKEMAEGLADIFLNGMLAKE